MQPTNQVPVLVVRERDYKGARFLSMSCTHAGQSHLTECETRAQGLLELAEATGLPVSSFYLTESEEA